MKRLHSIFTDDLDTCIISGYSGRVELHHVYAGARKALSEKYGFIAPLRPDLHPNCAHCTWSPEIAELDKNLKQVCQIWYERNIGSREEFIKEFGKGYL